MAGIRPLEYVVEYKRKDEYFFDANFRGFNNKGQAIRFAENAAKQGGGHLVVRVVEQRRRVLRVFR
jgi:hypothetical protein